MTDTKGIVANWQKFWPQTHKSGATTISATKGSPYGSKEAEIFFNFVLHTKDLFLQKHTVQSTYLLSFLITIVRQAFKPASIGKQCEWTNFSDFPAENLG
jgi:hypothetical protein